MNGTPHNIRENSQLQNELLSVVKELFGPLLTKLLPNILKLSDSVLSKLIPYLRDFQKKKNENETKMKEGILEILQGAS